MPQYTPEQLVAQRKIYDAYIADPSILNQYQGEQRKRVVSLIRYQKSIANQPEVAPAEQGQVVEADTSTFEFPTTTAINAKTPKGANSKTARTILYMISAQASKTLNNVSPESRCRLFSELLR